MSIMSCQCCGEGRVDRRCFALSRTLPALTSTFGTRCSGRRSPVVPRCLVATGNYLLGGRPLRPSDRSRVGGSSEVGEYFQSPASAANQSLTASSATGTKAQWRTGDSCVADRLGERSRHYPGSTTGAAPLRIGSGRACRGRSAARAPRAIREAPPHRGGNLQGNPS